MEDWRGDVICSIIYGFNEPKMCTLIFLKHILLYVFTHKLN